MNCPKCHNTDTDVIDSRDVDDSSIRRRRQCGKCKYRFTTYENIEPIKISILKRDGSAEPYDRNKLTKGIIKACEKRDIDRAVIEDVVDRIEQKLIEKNDNTVGSKVIGQLVIKELKNLDEVAYIRFASVYKNFSNCNSFIKEANKLIHKEENDPNRKA